MAAGVFMGIDLRHRKRLAPKLRNVFESLWMNFREHPRVDPDIGNAYATAMNAARQVNAENGRAVGIDRLDHVVRFPFYGPVETGTEQRIDNQRRPADRLRIER